MSHDWLMARGGLRADRMAMMKRAREYKARGVLYADRVRHYVALARNANRWLVSLKLKSPTQ